jgi:K+-sensing histidine kinase KdpD
MCDHRGDERVDRGGTAREPDLIRGLLHDLREPLAAILLLSASSTGDVDDRLTRIREQASWLSELVASSLDEAAGDEVDLVDTRAVAELVARRARTTTTASIGVESEGTACALARPVALARALACVVDNAVRAAGPEGHVVISVGDCGAAVHVRVVDDGPGPGRILRRTSIGLATTRAMVASCKGSFRLAAGPHGGAAAEISLPSARDTLAAS